jgi:hypothetical protein
MSQDSSSEQIHALDFCQAPDEAGRVRFV